jgi:ribose-phosphate pyrophosphokinase
MQKIDFTKGVGYEVISFPDGEKHLKINKLDRKDTVEIICRITNSDDLFLLMQLSDILNRQCVCVEKITIPYLMTMRCDRLFSFEQPFSLKIVADVVNSFKAKKVVIIEPHSNTCIDLIKNSKAENIIGKHPDDDFIYCLPDKGAALRYGSNGFIHKPIICTKKRDVETGKLTGFEIEDIGEYKEGNTIIVIDDLCDGGGTFVGIAQKIRELKPSKITLAITHAVQKEGIERVSGFYDKVIITNSYKDWKDLPSNVIVKNYFED